MGRGLLVRVRLGDLDKGLLCLRLRRSRSRSSSLSSSLLSRRRLRERCRLLDFSSSFSRALRARFRSFLSRLLSSSEEEVVIEGDLRLFDFLDFLPPWGELYVKISYGPSMLNHFRHVQFSCWGLG